MIEFKPETDFEAYDNFICANGGWYIQSSRWAKVKATWKCSYFSGFDGESRVAAALVMERDLPAAGKILYCPNGVVSVPDADVLAPFSVFAKSLCAERRATCFIMDPPVSLRINGETQESGEDMHRALIDLGFVLNPALSNYTYKQPVQLFIPLKDANGEQIPVQKLLKKCDKGVRYSIRLGLSRGLVDRTFHSDDVQADAGIMADFANVMKDTSSRDNFVERDAAYNAQLLKEFDGFSDLKIVYYDMQEDERLQAERLKKRGICVEQLAAAHEKKARALNEEISSIDKQTEHFNARKAEVEQFLASGGQTAKAKLGTDHTLIPLAGGLTIYYAGIGSCLFGGTKNVIRNETRSSHYLNYLRLCESIERGCAIHDLGYIIAKDPPLEPNGTLGKLEPMPNFEGILSFKKSFGSDLHEFIGEYVFVSNKAKYYAYTQLMPKAKKAKIALIKKLRKG